MREEPFMDRTKGEVQSIRKKLFYYVVIASFLITTFMTISSLYIDFRNENKIQELILKQIEMSSLKSLAEASWNFDDIQISKTASGLLEIHDVVGVTLKSDSGSVLFEKHQDVEDLENTEGFSSVKTFPLHYQTVDGQTRVVGSLDVEITKMHMYSRLFHKLFFFLILQGVHVFIFSFIMIFVFNSLVTRHLSAISKHFLSQEKTIGKTLKKFALKRKNEGQYEDEFTVIERSYNQLVDSLNQYLIESENRAKLRLQELGSLIQASRNEIYIFDLQNFKFKFANPAATENLGYTMEELENMSPWEIKPEYPKEKYLEAIQPLLSGKMKRLTFQTPHQRKDGSLYSAGIHIQIGKYEGKPSIFTIIIDEEERNSLQKQLFHSAKLASIGELAAGVGHEINNPLAIANGHVFIIKEQLTKLEIDDEVIESSMKKYKTATKRIADIVMGLRTFARADSNLFQEFNVKEAIKSTFSLIEVLYKKDGIALELSLPEEALYIKGNAGRMQQAIMNLLSNAKDALREVKDKSIALSLTRENNHAVLRIEDNGSGIPKDIRERIFDPFFTTKEVGEGTGIGLSLTASIVKEHEGQIDIESSNAGTAFCLSFPLSWGQNPEPQQEKNQEAAIATSRHPLKVLVVDDEEDLREIFGFLLETKFNCKVDRAENGVAALNLIDKKSYDLVFTDLSMPVMDGPTLIKNIKQLRLSPCPILIAMSGGALNDLQVKGRDEFISLIDSYLAKPFDEEKIRQILTEVFNKSQQARI